MEPNLLNLFSDKKKQLYDINFVDSFPYNIYNQNIIYDVSPLLLVSGYVAYKLISHISFEDCKLFGKKTIHLI